MSKVRTDYLFSSKRIGFRPMHTDDIETMFRISSDTEVMRYFPKLYEWSDAENLVQRMIQSQIEHGYSFYAVDLLADKICIGFIGFGYFQWKTDFSPCTEIGWRLDKRFWKIGLASEGAVSCLEYAQRELDISEVYSLTSKINLPSERVMQKIGMEKSVEFLHPAIDDQSPLNPHVLYHKSLKVRNS